LNLQLTDVSCSGATSVNVLEPWNELPAQVSAVTPDTTLVTVTIGGNDLNYVGNLYAASCSAIRAAQGKGGGMHCAKVASPMAADYEEVQLRLRKIVQEIRKRSSKARIIFVEYPTALPDGPLCAFTPMADEDAVILRETARKLAEVTEAAAADESAEVIMFAELSRGHDPCSGEPWMNGYLDRKGYVPVAYHPNLAGMTAIADSVVEQLKRR